MREAVYAAHHAPRPPLFGFVSAAQNVTVYTIVRELSKEVLRKLQLRTVLPETMRGIDRKTNVRAPAGRGCLKKIAAVE